MVTLLTDAAGRIVAVEVTAKNGTVFTTLL